MKDVVSKKCGGDPKCIETYAGRDIRKKDFVDSPPKRFSWVMMSSGCSVSCGEGSYFPQYFSLMFKLFECDTNFLDFI